MKTNIKHWIIDQIIYSILKTKYNHIVLSMDTICNKKFKDVFYLLDDNDMKRIVNDLACKKILINEDLLWEDTILNSVFNIGMYSPDDMHVPPAEYRSCNIDSSSSIDVISSWPTTTNVSSAHPIYTGDFEADIASLANKYPHAVILGCSSAANDLHESMLPAWQKLLNEHFKDPKKALADAISDYWVDEIQGDSCIDRDQILSELFDSIGYDYPYVGESDEYDDEEEDISSYKHDTNCKNSVEEECEEDDDDCCTSNECSYSSQNSCQKYNESIRFVSGYVDMEDVMTHTDSGLIAYVFSTQKTETCNSPINKNCYVVKWPKDHNSTGIILFNDPITKKRL